jgi:hypothetical protein
VIADIYDRIGKQEGIRQAAALDEEIMQGSSTNEMPTDSLSSAQRDAATICENYIEILRDERDARTQSETSILRSLANKEIDRLNGISQILKQNARAMPRPTEIGEQPENEDHAPRNRIQQRR